MNLKKISRSEVRNACFRAKKKTNVEKHKEILDLVSKELPDGYRFDNFTELWDILIHDNSIIIITPEIDYDFIHSTCLEYIVLRRMNQDTSSFTPRQLNVISIIESEMLGDLTLWEDYSKKWGITIDKELKRVKIKLFYKKNNQIDVTDDMIKASMKDADGSPLSVEDNVFETRVSSKEETDYLNKFLKKISTK